MKALIIYIVTWFLVLATAAGVNLAGYSSEMVETVFGFIYVTVFFAGVVMVLPFWMSERHSRKVRKA